MKKRILSLAFLGLSAVAAQAQLQFNHLDLSLTGGSTGVGLDVAVPVVKDVQLRTGFMYLPTFNKRMNFGIEVGEPDPNKTEEENAELNDSRFEKLSELLTSMSGLEVNNSVDMIGTPTFNNFKFLVDITPLKNKHWHFTAGVYLGGKRVAKAVNSIEDMSSLMAASMYNSMYYKALADEPMIVYGDFAIYNPALSQKFLDYGLMTMHVGDFSHDIIAQEDVYYDYTEIDDFDGSIIHTTPEFDEAGNVTNREVSLRCAKGEVLYHEGEAYRMVPDKECMVKVNAFINRVRPYVGFGYGGHIDKQKRTYVSVDAGAMIWGGVPKFVTEDGIDLINDLTNVRKSIKHYLDIAQKFPVYPVLEVRITQRLF